MSKKMTSFAFAMLFAVALGSYQTALAQDEATTGRVAGAVQASQDSVDSSAIYHPEGTIIIPESSIARPEDAGIRAHTNTQIFVPKGHALSSPLPPSTFAETPASLACVYKVGPAFAGCNPLSGSTAHPTGGWGAIALVDAFDNPNAASDLAFFSTHFGLPAATFTKIYANSAYGSLGGLTASCSGVPPGDTGWGLEEDLDIEYAHSMAPSAQILLVEACSNSYNDLFFAELVAGLEVTNRGGGDISNSWQGGESGSQIGGPSGWDNFFYRYYWKNITYFASSGDSGGVVGYPSTNPWVISVGGTTINRHSNGNFQSESCWSGSGGGPSTVETWENPPNSIYSGLGPWADYQYELFGGYPYAFPFRYTPDVALDADPNSGATVYDTYGFGGFLVVGGTSLASPAFAGIVNLSNNRLGQAPPGGGYYHTGEANFLYSQLNTKTDYGVNFYDVTTGSNGYATGPGYDLCTGIGTPRGKLGK